MSFIFTQTCFVLQEFNPHIVASDAARVKQRMCSMLQCVDSGKSNRVSISDNGNDSGKLNLTFEGQFTNGVSMIFKLCMREGTRDEVSGFLIILINIIQVSYNCYTAVVACDERIMATGKCTKQSSSTSSEQ